MLSGTVVSCPGYERSHSSDDAPVGVGHSITNDFSGMPDCVAAGNNLI